MADQDNDIHNRQKPSGDEEFDTKPRGKSANLGKSSAQSVRDAHFYENGVRADGTGGKPPESEQ